MSKATTQDRLAVKTPEAAFLHVLRREFNFSPRVSRELLNTAKEMLVGGVPSAAVRPGQVRLVVTSLKAPFGPPLEETDKVEVTLTVDAGAEDAQVGEREKAEGLRQGRILRLTEESLEQGGILTQEDLARALGVTARTIRRDVRILKKEGHLIQTRGFVKGVGRGQTHKVRIIELWLDREGVRKDRALDAPLAAGDQAVREHVLADRGAAPAGDAGGRDCISDPGIGAASERLVLAT